MVSVEKTPILLSECVRLSVLYKQFKTCTVLTSSLSRTKVIRCSVCVCVLYVGIGSKQCVSVCGSSCPRFPTLQGRSLPDAIISIGMHIL